MANDYNKTEAVDERLAELLRSSMVHKATGLQTSLKAMAATFEQVDNTLAEWLPKLDGNRLAARGTAFLLALNTQMSVSLSSLFHFLFQVSLLNERHFLSYELVVSFKMAKYLNL